MMNERVYVVKGKGIIPLQTIITRYCAARGLTRSPIVNNNIIHHTQLRAAYSTYTNLYIWIGNVYTIYIHVNGLLYRLFTKHSHPYFALKYLINLFKCWVCKFIQYILKVKEHIIFNDLGFFLECHTWWQKQLFQMRSNLVCLNC